MKRVRVTCGMEWNGILWGMCLSRCSCRCRSWWYALHGQNFYFIWMRFFLLTYFLQDKTANNLYPTPHQKQLKLDHLSLKELPLSHHPLNSICRWRWVQVFVEHGYGLLFFLGLRTQQSDNRQDKTNSFVIPNEMEWDEMKWFEMGRSRAYVMMMIITAIIYLMFTYVQKGSVLF